MVSPPTPSRRSSRPTLVVVFAVFAIALPLIGYYLAIELPDRTRYFTQSKFRALGVLAEQIESTIENRLNAVRAAATSADGEPARKIGLIRDLTYVPGTRPQCTALSNSTSEATSTSTTGRTPTLGAEAIPGSIYVEPGVAPTGRHTGPLVIGSTGLVDDGATRKTSSTVYFRYDCQSTTADDRCGSQTTPAAVVCAKAELGELLSVFIDASNLNETDLFIADTDGRVLFERGKTDLRIAKLPRSSAHGHEPSPREGGATATPSDADAIQSKGLPFIEQLTRASSLHDIEQNSKPYKLFTQPIRLPATTNVARGLAAAPAESTVWVLGALVPAKDFESDVSGVSLGSLGYLPLALLLVVLMAPALKLGIMAPRDRLSRNDVRLLVVGTLLASGISTVIALDMWAYRWLQAALDAQGESISRQLEADFRQELAGASAVLRQFVDKRARDGAKKVRLLAQDRFGDSALRCSPASRREFRESNPNLFPCQGTNLFTARELSECSSWTDPALNYHLFDLIFWTDECGQQWEKWTALSEMTPLTDMYDLTPFQNTIQQRLWKVESISDPLSVDLQVSPNTGQRLAEISIPILDDGAPIGVAGLIAQLVSFYQPVLPPGFGFAVVQDDGLVVFHSQRQRSLYENFFEELSNAKPLRSLVAARRVGTLEADYHGRAQRLYTHPIADAPWSLIVYYDEELLRTVDLDILLTWLLLFLAYVAAAIVVWWLIRLALPGDDADWMWPGAQRRSAYAASTIVLVLFAGGFLSEIVWGDSLGMLVMTATVPAASMAYVYLQLASEPGRVAAKGRRWRLRLARTGLIISAAFVVYSIVALQPSTGWWAGLIAVGWVLVAAAAVGLLRPGVLEPDLVKADAWMPRWFWEISLGLTLLSVFTVLPAITFYRDAFEQGVEVFIRHGQLRLAEGLVARDHRIIQQYHDIWNAADLDHRLQNKGDLPAAGLFWDGGLQLGKAPLPPASNTRSSNAADFVTPTPPAGAHPNAPDMGIAPDLRRIVGRHFSGLLMVHLLVYHAESMQLRNMIDDRADDHRWAWDKDCCGRGVLSYAGPSGKGAPGTRVLKSRRPIPLLPTPTAPLEWICAGVALLLSLIVGYVTLRWLADRIFGLRSFSGADDNGLSRPEDGEARIRGALLINPPQEVANRVLQGVRPIDMHIVKGSLDILGEAAIEGPDAWIVLHHLDHRLDDPALNRSKLALLERLVLGGRKPVFIISRVDPLIYFRERLRSPGDTKADENYVTPDEIDRWARVLERLVKIDLERWGFDAERVAAYLDGLKGLASLQPFWTQVAAAAALQQLWEECRWTASLRGVACAAAGLRATPVDDDSLVEYVRDLARPYYRSLWWLLTDEECLVLIHLAKEGFVNPRNWRLVRRLEAKGLVRRTPALRLMNESFRQFVLSEENPQQVRDWEGAAGPSPWAAARNVLLAVLMVVGVFVALFQPATLNILVGSLTALVGALGALTTLFGFFQRGRTAPPPPPGS